MANFTEYRGNARVECQGDNPLRVLSLDKQCATYRVNGCNQTGVYLTDYRQKCLAAARRAAAGNDASDFVTLFSQPANIIFALGRNQKSIDITIHDADLRVRCDVVLWIAVGAPGMLPIFDYLYYNYEKIAQRKYALIALYNTRSQQ